MFTRALVIVSLFMMMACSQNNSQNSVHGSNLYSAGMCDGSRAIFTEKTIDFCCVHIGDGCTPFDCKILEKCTK